MTHIRRIVMAGFAAGALLLAAAPVGGAAPCPEDLNGDNEVGFGDVLQVIANWGPCPEICPEDLSGNGVVDFADILFLISAWGPCP
ncbi:MAG: hypothetical protein GY715_00355 [Planctomycetes bacterium]|nr:hypothetical protein [Planctomycetota bacterium]